MLASSSLFFPGNVCPRFRLSTASDDRTTPTATSTGCLDRRRALLGIIETSMRRYAAAHTPSTLDVHWRNRGDCRRSLYYDELISMSTDVKRSRIIVNLPGLSFDALDRRDRDNVVGESARRLIANTAIGNEDKRRGREQTEISIL